MTPRGLEPDNASGDDPKHLQNPAESGGAESGAESRDSVHLAADLRQVIDAWPDLPGPVKVGILAMVDAAGTDKGVGR